MHMCLPDAEVVSGSGASVVSAPAAEVELSATDEADKSVGKAAPAAKKPALEPATKEPARAPGSGQLLLLNSA
jgi:hypothetical protein